MGGRSGIARRSRDGASDSPGVRHSFNKSRTLSREPSNANRDETVTSNAIVRRGTSTGRAGSGGTRKKSITTLLNRIHTNESKIARAWNDTFTAASSVIQGLRGQQEKDRAEVHHWMSGAARLRESMLQQESEANRYLEAGRELVAEKTEADAAWSSMTTDLRSRIEKCEVHEYTETRIVRDQRRLIEQMRHSESAHAERFQRTESSQDESLVSAERRLVAMRNAHLESQHGRQKRSCPIAALCSGMG